MNDPVSQLSDTTVEQLSPALQAAVTRAGYKSKNKTLAKSIGIALSVMSTVEKVGRGQFKLK